MMGDDVYIIRVRGVLISFTFLFFRFAWLVIVLPSSFDLSNYATSFVFIVWWNRRGAGARRGDGRGGGTRKRRKVDAEAADGRVEVVGCYSHYYQCILRILPTTTPHKILFFASVLSSVDHAFDIWRISAHAALYTLLQLLYY